MATRSIDAWNEHGWTVSNQHPAVRLTMALWSPATRATLPRGEGCYIPVQLLQQKSYVGHSESLRDRVPASIQANLPAASHLVLVEPLGFAWGEQREDLESILIRVVPGAVNRSPGKTLTQHSPYLEAVSLEVVDVLAPLLFAAGSTGWSVPSQGRVARDLVLQEHRHPLTVGELTLRLQGLGWSARGRTVHRTLRRDCLDHRRGGSSHIRVTGPWPDPDTQVYVEGRRYASGWTPPVRSLRVTDREPSPNA